MTSISDTSSKPILPVLAIVAGSTAVALTDVCLDRTIVSGLTVCAVLGTVCLKAYRQSLSNRAVALNLTQKKLLLDQQTLIDDMSTDIDCEHLDSHKLRYIEINDKLAEMVKTGCFSRRSPVTPEMSDAFASQKLIHDTLTASETRRAAPTAWSILESITSEIPEGKILNNPGDALHRYPEIRCPAETAVCVYRDTGALKPYDPSSRYSRELNRFLHANIVKGKIEPKNRQATPLVVASQVPIQQNPLFSHFNDRETFWMACRKNNFAIIDLIVDNEFTVANELTGVNECEPPYFPSELNESMQFGGIYVKLTTKEGRQDHGYEYEYEVRKAYSFGGSKKVRRIAYKWAGGSEPVGGGALDFLLELAERFLGEGKNLWVSCSDGNGRSGTLITALSLKEKIDKREISAENLEDSLIDMILEFRQKRGRTFVNSKAQFNLLLEYGRLLISRPRAPTTSTVSSSTRRFSSSRERPPVMYWGGLR